MKRNIRRCCVAIGLGMVALAVFGIADIFFIGAAKAENKINAYEQMQYMHPKTVEMKYDWYSGSGYIGQDYRYDPQKDLIVDEERNELWYKYFERKMESLQDTVKPNMLIKDYSLMTYYDGNDADIRYDDLFIYGIYNTQPVEEECRAEVATELVWNIIKTFRVDYNLCGVHIDYYDLSGVYRFSINLEKETITKERLAASIKEVSFTDNLSIEEKWQEFCAQRKTFFTMPVADYEIALVGMEEYGDYQLVQRTEEAECVLGSYQRGMNNPTEYIRGTFENILGMDGFYIYEGTYFLYGDYYIIEDGILVKIAETFGTVPENCYALDINKDGMNEFICNVMYGTGGTDVCIYYNDGTQILEGYGSGLVNYDIERVIPKSISAWYIPEENVVCVRYHYEDEEEYREERCELDLNRIEFYPFKARE